MSLFSGVLIGLGATVALGAEKPHRSAAGCAVAAIGLVLYGVVSLLEVLS